MKPVDVKSGTYINSSKEINDEDTKFIILLEYQNREKIAKCVVPNWSEEDFVIKIVKNTVPWTCVIIDLKCEEIVGKFYKKELQKTNQKEFRVEKY